MRRSARNATARYIPGVRRPMLLAGLAVLAAVTACSGSSARKASSAPSAAAVAHQQSVATDAELYAAPHPIPDVPHGTLLKYQSINGLVADGHAYRVMYASRSLRNEPIVVTGIVVIPSAPAPPQGRFILTTAHGTTGIADTCAPSAKPSSAEARLIAPAAVRNGWIMAETDYEGLGTPGRHPYLVGESEGRGVLDAAIAASQLPDAHANNKLLIAGYSQGGHGALFANQIAKTWSPQYTVIGTFAGAPATEIDTILRAGRSAAINGFTVSIVAGYQAAYPEADPSLYLTPRGVSLLATVDQGCITQVFAATARTPPNEVVRADGPDSPVWMDLARRNNPGAVRTDDPVLIIHSDKDDVVPIALSALLHTRMCATGQVVERRVLHNAGGHVAAAPGAYAQGLDWLRALTTGAAPTNDCK